MPSATVQQLAIPDDSFGELTEYDGSTADSGLLRARLDESGYVLFRGVLDRDEVLAAREEVFRRFQRLFQAVRFDDKFFADHAAVKRRSRIIPPHGESPVVVC